MCYILIPNFLILIKRLSFCKNFSGVFFHHNQIFFFKIISFKPFAFQKHINSFKNKTKFLHVRLREGTRLNASGVMYFFWIAPEFSFWSGGEGCIKFRIACPMVKGCCITPWAGEYTPLNISKISHAFRRGIQGTENK